MSERSMNASTDDVKETFDSPRGVSLVMSRRVFEPLSAVRDVSEVQRGVLV